jgi:L-fuconolactonase
MDDIIDPPLPIIDPHHHIWTAAHGKYDYLLPELLADVGSGHNIVQTVYCECKSTFRQGGPEELRPVGETEFVVEAMSRGGAAATNLCGGLVMFADLTLGARVQPVLDAHHAAAGERFKGIRNIAAYVASPLVRSFVANPALLAEPAVREGVACLGRNGLVFETFVFHPQLPQVAELAAACSDTTIVLNAFGGPLGVGPYKDRRGKVFAEWRRGIGSVAEQPNVNVHIGGFGAKMLGFGFHKRPVPPTMEDFVAAWKPYLHTCLEAFGPQRCMLTSNFPEDRSSITYRQVWNVFKYLCRDLAADEKTMIFSGTSAKLYKLDP